MFSHESLAFSKCSSQATENNHYIGYFYLILYKFDTPYDLTEYKIIFEYKLIGRNIFRYEETKMLYNNYYKSVSGIGNHVPYLLGKRPLIMRMSL